MLASSIISRICLELITPPKAPQRSQVLRCNHANFTRVMKNDKSPHHVPPCSLAAVHFALSKCESWTVFIFTKIFENDLTTFQLWNVVENHSEYGTLLFTLPPRRIEIIPKPVSSDTTKHTLSIHKIYTYIAQYPQGWTLDTRYFGWI